MTNKNFAKMFEAMMDQYEHDLAMAVTMTMLSVLTLAVLAVASTTVWPILVAMLFSPAAASMLPVLRMLLIINLGLLVLYAAIAAVTRLLNQPFSFSKLATMNFLFGMIANMLYLFAHNGAFPLTIELDFLMTPLWFILSFFLSCILSFTPAVVAAAVSKVTCTLIGLFG